MRISIITVNLNNREGLENTFSSVTSQTIRPYEWIIVDGDSTDGSKELIEANSNIVSRWISEKDSGVYSAMNKGIRMASGDYLLFLNSGDSFAQTNTLEQLIATKCKTDYLLGYNLIKVGNRFEKMFIPNKITFYHLYLRNLWHQSMLIRKDVFEKYGYYDETLKIVSDWKQYTLALCLHRCSYTIYKDFISVNDNLGLSNTRGHLELLIQERESVLEEYFPYFIPDYTRLHKLYRMTPKGLIKGFKRIASVQKNRFLNRVK